MSVKFVKETLGDSPAIQAAINICEVVAPKVSDKTRVVSEIIQIAKNALREGNSTAVTAMLLTEKFCRDGDRDKISKKVSNLVKANSKEFMNP